MRSNKEVHPLQRREFLRLTSRLLLVSGGASLLGCGGGGGGDTPQPSPSPTSSSLPGDEAGHTTFQRSVTIPSGGTSVTDPETGFTVTVPSGAMQNSANLEATVWSGQRSAVPRTNFTTSLRAFDVALTPSQIIDHNTLTVKLPWNMGANALATMVVAFGTEGRALALRDAPGSTPESPSALIGASEIQYLLGASAIPTGKVSLQFAVAESTPARAAVPVKDAQLVELWRRPTSRTHYASRTRVAIVVHGILNDETDLAALKELLEGRFTTEGDIDPTAMSPGFDMVAGFTYNWQASIAGNGQILAAKINAEWGDPSKYEVHIFAHSMGGLVSRYAVEKVGTPSVTQLGTLGTPHTGVPLTVLKNIALNNLALGAAYLAFSLLLPGVSELLDSSDLIASLGGSSAPNVQYQAIAGTSHANFKGHLGDIIEFVYLLLNPHHIDHDGIVPATSALGGPATITDMLADNHSELIDRVTPASLIRFGLIGMNRKVKALKIAPDAPTVAVGEQLLLSVAATDKDGDTLDPKLLIPPFLPVVWSIDQPDIAKIDPSTGMVRGISAGTATVTVTAASSVQTTTGQPVSQTIPVIVTLTDTNPGALADLHLVSVEGNVDRRLNRVDSINDSPGNYDPNDVLPYYRKIRVDDGTAISYVLHAVLTQYGGIGELSQRFTIDIASIGPLKAGGIYRVDGYPAYSRSYYSELKNGLVDTVWIHERFYCKVLSVSDSQIVIDVSGSYLKSGSYSPTTGSGVTGTVTGTITLNKFTKNFTG